ncbi:MAG: DUF2271 domain-containing protein [Bacteroidales bacterium]|nr:DUF2271 domain-containing protein [Bacteroidales bacterium]
MKNRTKFFALSLLSLCMLTAVVCAKEGSSAKAGQQAANTVVVSYDLHKIPVYATNQWAIWVEDSSGKFIRTLFATRFTAKGGYIKRTSSLKTWVEKSFWKDASAEEIDALSSATPSAGGQSVTWDCTDKKGNKVPDGKYTICMEGNLRQGKMMYAKAIVSVGGKSQKITADLNFVPEEGKSEPLFENVTVEYIK